MRTILLLYVAGMITYGIYSTEKDLLLPFILAVAMTVVIRVVLYIFSEFTPTEGVKQILYLFLVSMGMQYLPLITLLSERHTEVAFAMFQYILLIPVICCIGLLLYCFFFTTTEIPAPAVQEMELNPIIETVKKEPILYYEIFDFKPQRQIIARMQSNIAHCHLNHV